jgi:hypothetical protein
MYPRNQEHPMKKTTIALAIASASLVAATHQAHAEVNQPIEIIDRPRVLPESELEAKLGFDFHREAVKSAAGTTTAGFTTSTIGAGYGVAKDLELRLDYTFGIDPSTGKGPLNFAAGYGFLNAGPLTAAVKGGLGYDIGLGELRPLNLGADVQFKISEKFALFTPGQQLIVSLAGSAKPIYLQAPIGLKYQAARNIYTQFSTNVLEIGLSNKKSGVFGADFIPVDIAAVYSLNNGLDFGAQLGDDLKDAGGSISVGVFGRLFL